MTDRDRPERTVLLVSDNGHGLGHVTRMMAVARRFGDAIRPVLLTLSEAHPVVREQGFPVEYFPSRLRLRLMKSRWSPMFALRLLDAIERFQPAVVVVDHVAPADAVAVARDAHPEVTFVWSRRGLWKPGHNDESLAIRAWFDHVLEPGDVAAAYDAGATTTDDGPVTRVAPITLLSREELLPRDEARAALGLPVTGACVLVALSADDPGALERMIRRVRDVTDRAMPDVHLFAPRHALHGDRLADVPGVTLRPVYPVARYLRAFDLAVTAAGYNTVHEIVSAGVPGVFVPKVTDSVDDQEARARGAAAEGHGWAVSDLDAEPFEIAVREGLSGRLAQPPADPPSNGAVDAARFLTHLAAERPPPRSLSGVEPPQQEALEGAWDRFLSGDTRAARAVPRRVLDVVDLPDDQLRELARSIVAAQEQAGEDAVKTVLLVGAGSDVGPLSEASIAYETCLSAEDARALVPHVTFEAYRARRLASCAEVFGAAEQRRLTEVTDAAPERPSAASGLRRRLARFRDRR